jgi:hypothetical protein
VTIFIEGKDTNTIATTTAKVKTDNELISAHTQTS